MTDDIATPEPVVEAGRVFSAANEQSLRGIATALNALLAQVQQAPVATDPGAPAPPAQAPAQAPPQPVQQAAVSDADTVVQEAVVALGEAAKGGSGLIKVIDAGWGTSGYYGRDVLERDASVAFPAGTKMFWDHPTIREADERPERSLRDLAAETTAPARWMDDGPVGPGVYAQAAVFSRYRPALEELKDHIGVSIRAGAHVRDGKAEGKKGRLIERLLPSPVNSIDFVTIPGRGGQVAALFEAARGLNAEVIDVSEAELRAAQDALAEATRERDEARDRATRAETAAALVGARAVTSEALAATSLPDAAREAIIERVAGNPPIKDGALDADALRALVTAEAAKEQDYIDRLTGRGEVRGMGSASAPTTAPDMTAAFARLGLSESAAKTAAAGRRQ